MSRKCWLPSKDTTLFRSNSCYPVDPTGSHLLHVGLLKTYDLTISTTYVFSLIRIRNSTARSSGIIHGRACTNMDKSVECDTPKFENTNVIDMF